MCTWVVLQCVAVCCSVLKHVVACCSVLQRASTSSPGGANIREFVCTIKNSLRDTGAPTACLIHQKHRHTHTNVHSCKSVSLFMEQVATVQMDF